MESRLQIIARLQIEIEKNLRPLLPTSPFALVDFPDHSNVGDSAIWMGECEFFRGAGCTPVYVSTWKNVNWRKLKETIGPNGVIFIHGGGNFTDIYPHHQDFCSEILARFKGHRIVQLPQTIFYNSPDRADEIARRIEEHGNFVLFARDAASFEVARRLFQCEIRLCPDMAFVLGPLQDVIQRQRRTLFLLRTDHEKRGEILSASGSSVNVVCKDWLTEPVSTRPVAAIEATIKHFLKRRNCRPAQAILREGYYDQLSHDRVDRGLTLLGSYERIVSDRLHVHILSTLLGIPHILLDNKYGKIANYVETWATIWDGVERAESPAQAVAKIEDAAGELSP